MTARARLPVLALLLAVATIAAGCGGGNQDGFGLIDWPEGTGVETGFRVGDRAPNFRLETLSGAPIELAAYTGRPVLLAFLASWCANCREEMETFQSVSESGFAVIGINYRESADTVRALAAKTGATFPIALDRDAEVSREGFAVTNLPVTVLVDATGTIREIVRGPVDGERLAGLIRTVETEPAEGD